MTGKRANRSVRLRKPEKRDVDIITEWMQDREFMMYLYGDPIRSKSQLRKTILSQFSAVSATPYPTIIFLIIENEKGEAIGLISFNSISWKNRNALMEIYLDKEENRNRLYGPRASLAAVTYAFKELNLRRIGAYIYSYNTRSARMTERVGAKREAVLRKHVYRDGEYHDMYGYGLLREEYDEFVEQNKDRFIARGYV